MTVDDHNRDGETIPLTIGEPLLRGTAATVSDSGMGANELRELGNRLRAVVLARDAIGLAAPQIGVAVRVIALNASAMCQVAALEDGEHDVVVHVDPIIEVIDSADQVRDFEGCLSVPRIAGVVRRPRRVFYRARRLDGSEVAGELVKRAARVVQHEVDHLEGVLFLDWCPPRSLVTFGALERIYQGDAVAAGKALGFVA